MGPDSMPQTRRQTGRRLQAPGRQYSRCVGTWQADKSEVEQTAAGFVDTARQAVSDVNAAGKAQVDAIKTAGQGASNAVETAKTTAVQAVTAEGDKQVQRVQEAAAGVEADREQINQNKPT